MIIYNDVSEPWQIGFQDSSSPGYTGIIELHNTIFFYLIIIFIAVFYYLISIINNNNKISHKYITHGSMMETVWTITPATILISIALPSFRLLYLLDEVISPTITIKVLGHQWYWSYEYNDYDILEYDSYMIDYDSLLIGSFRLLDVDNRLIIPVDTHVRLIVSGADVIHSFAVPSLAIKIDAVPGRLNHTTLFADRTGVFYGQCSEICGILHGFMPIAVECMNISRFIDWLTITPFNLLLLILNF